MHVFPILLHGVGNYILECAFYMGWKINYGWNVIIIKLCNWLWLYSVIFLIGPAHNLNVGL